MQKLLLSCLLAVTCSLLLAPVSSAGTVWDLPVVPTVDNTADSYPSITVTLDKLRSEYNTNVGSGKVKSRSFMKMGDSITDTWLHLRPFGCTGLATYPSTSSTDLARKATGVFIQNKYTNISPFGYAKESCPPSSFTRNSISATGGFPSGYAMQTLSTLKNNSAFVSLETRPTRSGAQVCSDSDTPLSCEWKVMTPMWALVMFGTNDSSFGLSAATFQANISAIVTALRSRNTIPILSTIPRRIDGFKISSGQLANDLINQYNQKIIDLADNRDVLVLNYWRSMEETRATGGNKAWIYDGVHPSVKGYYFCSITDPLSTCAPGDLSSSAVAFGHNRRNLITLNLLGRLANRFAL